MDDNLEEVNTGLLPVNVIWDMNNSQQLNETFPSESGSITPEALYHSCNIDKNLSLLVKVLESVSKLQDERVDQTITSLVKEYEQVKERLNELEKILKRPDGLEILKVRLSDNIETMKTSKEAQSIVDKSFEEHFSEEEKAARKSADVKKWFCRIYKSS